MLNTIARNKYIKVVVFNHNHLENQQKLSKYINTLKISIQNLFIFVLTQNNFGEMVYYLFICVDTEYFGEMVY